MNVLFLSQIVPYPPHGGVLQRGYNLLRELGRHAQVHLLAFVHPDALPTPTALDESRAALGQFCETIEFFPLWPKQSRLHLVAALAASTCSRKPFSVIAHRSAAFQARVTERLAAVPFDILHVDTLALSRFVPHDRHLPAVLTHHNIESMLMKRRSEVETRLLARQFLRREAEKLKACEEVEALLFDMNITMSRQDEMQLLSRVPRARTSIVPNGVDIEYFTPRPELETPTLIYGGGMNMFANRDAVMHFLHEIWPLIRARVPGVRFLAVGQAPPTELTSYAAIDPQVVVTGYVEDIRPCIWEAGIYVVPLRVGGGTRLKVLDAMAMGKAIVSTSIGCEGIEVTPGEHLVVADSPEDFASATVSLLGDPSRRRELGQAARNLVERRYAWPQVGQRLLDAYRTAIACHQEVAFRDSIAATSR